jgi:hypothetical protein
MKTRHGKGWKKHYDDFGSEQAPPENEPFRVCCGSGFQLVGIRVYLREAKNLY